MNNEKWTKEECKKLKKIYKEHTNKELAEIFNRSVNGIQCKKKRLGLTENISKKNRGNQHFFDIINTEEKAYWLGFIYADGYIIGGKTNSELGIELNYKDVEHLNKFNSIFNNYYKVTKKIKTYDAIDRLNNKPISNRVGEMCLIRIYSKSICDGLIKNNVVPGKTYSSIYPMINDKKLFLDFLRGYIDGDGSYSIKKVKNHKYPRITIQGNNKECFEYISNRLKKEFNIASSIYSDRQYFKFEIHKTKDCMELINLMYDNANIYLDRKFDKVQELKSIAV